MSWELVVTWAQCTSERAQELRLTEQQQQQLLTIRTNHLAELRKVLVDRQSLNMQVCTALQQLDFTFLIYMR